MTNACHRVTRVEKAADPFVCGSVALADPGLRAAVRTVPSAGARGGRRAAGTGAPLAGLPAPTPPPSFRFLVPAMHSPWLPPLQALDPISLPSLGPSHARWAGALSVQTPGPRAALTLGPQAEGTETEASPLWNKSKSKHRKRASGSQKAWVRTAYTGSCVKSAASVCASVSSSAGRTQTYLRGSF